MDIDQATEMVLLHLKEFIISIPKEDIEHQTVPKDQSLTHLTWMIDTLLENKSWPIDKKSRWLGFIQGVCVCRFGLDVNEERDFTRPLFHQAYKNSNKSIPKTVIPPSVNPSFVQKKNMS